ncbi:hypothetical protein [Pantoea sp. BAV 3049]|uniref:hypothetical protein n=1 Tax=Pantoea sp. BAV 3049 TaxID=2654188 RepID=UPI00131D558D|nr:hypothetical protein [Pantoea sp. BAV 3049]
MSKFTFVVEYEDGKEPVVNVGTQILSGKLCSISFFDYRDDFFTSQQRNKIENVLEEAEWDDHITGDEASLIMEKVEMMTQ